MTNINKLKFEKFNKIENIHSLSKLYNTKI